MSSDFIAVTNPFSGAKFKIERAYYHIESLATQTYEYGLEAKVEFGTLSAGRDRQVNFVPPPPADIGCIVGDAAHNLRSSLDIMVCDVARMKGRSTKNVRFPFGTDKVHFDGRLRDTGFSKIDSVMTEIVQSLEPFPSGNKSLRDLHDLDIQDKHELLVPVFFKSAALMQPGAYVAAGYAQTLNQLIEQHGIPRAKSIGKCVPVLYGDTHGTTIEIDGVVNYSPILGDMPREVTIKHGEFVFFGDDTDPLNFMRPLPGIMPLVFPDADFPFAGKPVLETLENVAKTVSEILELFIVKFAAGN
ncbi:hypothetical protein [Sphingomonas sp. GB1N7]|uniref:hypothetical protein n=1 Tax=Parasphingomonas caseinilytica TaxID=3096158 RepID=UPI002FC8B953